jgi:hypothetical protein
MSIVRRGGFGALAPFGSAPHLQCFIGQIILMLQFVVQVRVPDSLSMSLANFKSLRCIVLHFSAHRPTGGPLSRMCARMVHHASWCTCFRLNTTRI